MKKTIVATMLLGFVVGSMTLMPAISANNDDKGTISVNTTANAEVAPDVAEISFTVRTSDLKSMQKATAMNKEISDKVFAELSALINKQNGDYIKTSNFSANPIYTYRDKKQVLDKYEVTNSVIVHTKSIDKVGKMIDKAIISGATNVGSLNFSVSNYDTKCDELITQASKKARARADMIARAVNSSVIGVNNISTSCSANNYSQPRFYMAKNMVADVAAGASAEESSTTISNGSVKVNANVNASFFVK